MDFKVRPGFKSQDPCLGSLLNLSELQFFFFYKMGNMAVVKPVSYVVVRVKSVTQCADQWKMPISDLSCGFSIVKMEKPE